MRFVTDYPVVSGEWVDPAVMVSVARELEAAGFDGLGFTDHPAPSAKWLEAGGHETFDPFAAMAFCSAVTARLILFSHLVVVPYRNPLLQASSMATVDVLSGGRTVFVLGAGYLRSEFAALGVDFDERNELFDEGVEVIERYLGGEDLSYRGRHFTAVGQRRRPLPVQRPLPPLWVGGNSSRALARVARWGAGWSAMVSPPGTSATARTRPIETLDDLARAIAEIARLAEAQGRSLEQIDLSASSPLIGPGTGAGVQQQLDEIGRLRELGVGWVRVELGHGSLGRSLDELREFSATVLTAAR